MRLGCGFRAGEIAGLLIDPKTDDRWATTLADIKHLAVGSDRHDRWAAGRQNLALLPELAGFIDRKDRDLVRILQPNIEHIRHRTPPCKRFPGASPGSIWRPFAGVTTGIEIRRGPGYAGRNQS